MNPNVGAILKFLGIAGAFALWTYLVVSGFATKPGGTDLITALGSVIGGGATYHLLTRGGK